MSTGARKLRGDRCQCGACNEYFNSTKAFDRHRRGTPGQDRRCLTPDEMALAGMSTNATGWWITAIGGRVYVHYAHRTGDLPPDIAEAGVNETKKPETEQAA